jgi:hypothetical protein
MWHCVCCCRQIHCGHVNVLPNVLCMTKLLCSHSCSARRLQQCLGLLQITTAACQCSNLLLARAASHLHISAEGRTTTAAWPHLCEYRLSSVQYTCHAACMLHRACELTLLPSANTPTSPLWCTVQSDAGKHQHCFAAPVPWALDLLHCACIPANPAAQLR